MHTRPFNPSEEEYATIVDIFNRERPYWKDVAENWKHHDKHRTPDLPYFRDVIEQDGQIIAFGEYGQFPWHHHPEKYVWDVVIDPDYESQSIREAYLEYALGKLADENPLAIKAGAREDHENLMTFFHLNGFIEMQRNNVSALDLTTFDSAPFDAVYDKVIAGGIEILNLKEFQARNPHWQHDLWELDWLVFKDVPMPDPPKKRSFEEFVNQTLKSPSFNADYWTIALDGDLPVAVNNLWPSSGDPEKIFTGLTGVIRSHRRRGIATAVKLPALKTAIENGYKFTETENEENNPMYQINVNLGFKPIPAFVNFEKKLREDSASK